MSQVKVWNDNHLDFKQIWKGDSIFIPAKSYIEMDFEEANSFKCASYPMKFDGMGQQLPESYKMIRVEGNPADHIKASGKYKCQLDGQTFESQEALNAHIRDNYLDQIEDQDFAKDFATPVSHKAKKGAA